MLRILVQAVCYIVEGFAALCDRVALSFLRYFFKTEYERKGQCQMTGQCCKMVGLSFPKSWLNYPRLTNTVKSWHAYRYNFSYLGTVDSMHVYECRYLTKDNKCGIHRFKPRLCRDYPVTPWYGFTKVYKGCGYRFEKRGAKEFEKILQKNAKKT